MAKTVSEALQGWKDYTEQLKAANADLVARLETANATAQQLRDTDAAEDAAQAQELTEQIAQQIADALDAAQNPPAEPPADEPVEEPPA